VRVAQPQAPRLINTACNTNKKIDDEDSTLMFAKTKNNDGSTMMLQRSRRMGSQQ